MIALSESNSKHTYWKRNLPVLWIGVFLCCASYTSCVPFLPIYLLRDLGVEQADVNYWAGITFSITFLGSSIMAPYWGALADHVGQRKMAVRAGFGLALTYFLTGVCQNVYQLLLVRALCGVVAGFVPACMSMASSSLPEHKMGWGMGLMQTAVASGSIMGPLLGGYLSSWFGMRMSFLVGSAALFVATVAVIFIVKDMTVLQKGGSGAVTLLHDLRESLRNKELLYVMLMFFTVQSCIMLIQPLITMYVGQLMGTMGDEVVKMSGVIFSLAGLAGIIAAPFWGKRGQRFGYIRTFAVVTFIAGFINLFQVFIANVWQFAVIQFVYGLFLAGAVPNINANLTLVTDKNTRGKAFGLVTSAQQFGGVVGPLLGGFLGAMMATRYVLVTTGCILMCTALYSYLTRVRGK
ncbi:MFS transporter [uncultured Phascolarctobacterium sp.]|uniref:MFS transporter n=1 Tax=uncultured Phascolarctobacterium sp. TaxID=512296 RepID=UPI0025DC1054|nr:MFS transporter [uncultured Phascolarctobacterium sp.]